MDNVDKLLEDIIDALDGHTAVTSEEANLILERGYLPVDEFMQKVKAIVGKTDFPTNSKPNVHNDK